MTFPGTSILSIEPVSPAARAGLRAGDVVVLCNDSPVRDWVDMLAVSSQTSVSLCIKRGMLKRTIVLKRRPGVSWGIDLDGSRMRHCRNKCVFCFVDQQPPGLRDSLYVKDDDVRHSFLHGTYITLTEQQAEEAIARGFNSLHVSVQTTNAVLRGKLLGLPDPLEILPLLDRLSESGIEVQAQVVEVPGWNDGEELENTISDLYTRDNISILGIVPVGLTKWREGLESLSRPNAVQAEQTLNTVKKWQSKAMKEKDRPWIYAADEYFAITGEDVPGMSFYGDNTLVSNGIGLLAAMIENSDAREFHGSGAILTGTMAAPYIEKAVKNSGYRVVPLENTLMGPEVSVAGLLSGTDVIDAIQNSCVSGETVFLPSVMFNYNGITLDEYTLDTIREITGFDAVSADTIEKLP
jgi:putative radical SAM enzyme (TIGR03279 family)